MKKEIYCCDLCEKRVDEDKIHKGHFVNVLNNSADDVNVSKYTDAKLDLCDDCLNLCSPVMQNQDGSYKLRNYYIPILCNKPKKNIKLALTGDCTLKMKTLNGQPVAIFKKIQKE